MVNTETGEKRHVKFTKADKESIKKGDLLQPVGKDRSKFLETHGYLPGEDKADTDRYLKKRGLHDKVVEGEHKRKGWDKLNEQR